MAPGCGLERLSRNLQVLLVLHATALVRGAFDGDGYCGVALMQGYREAMEDKALCLEPIRVNLCPFKESEVPAVSEQRGHTSEQSERQHLEVRAYAVFDGHGGGEASEYAARHIQDMLTFHLRSITSEDGCKELRGGKSAFLAKSASIKGTKLLQKLSMALERTLLQLDADFVADAERRGIMAGTTACVALLVQDTWLQVANIGDSRAILCSAPPPSGCPSQCILPPRQGKRRKKSGLCALELTRDHRFDRADEVERVTRAGGVVLDIGGVKRLMGVSMPSRAIGDADLKPFGMTSDPELSDWINVDELDGQYLVVASDGLFEDIAGGQCVCDLIEGIGDDSGGQERQPAIPLGPSSSFQGGASVQESNQPLNVAIYSESEHKKEETPRKEATKEESQDEEFVPSKEGEMSRTGGICLFKESSPNEELDSEKKGSAEGLSHERPERDYQTDSIRHTRSAGTNGAGLETDHLLGTQSSKGDSRLPVQIAERLRDAAFRKGSMDNIAVVVADLRALQSARERSRSLFKDEENETRHSLVDKKKGRGEGIRKKWSDPRTSKSLQVKVDNRETGALQVSDSEAFKVFISGQVVHGEGSDWCYQLLELVSGLRALPAPNPIVPTGPIETVPLEPIHTEPQNALPESPSAWGTTLDLYHRHLIATVKPQSDGLAAILDVVASVPIQPGRPADLQPGWEGRPGEATEEEVWMPAGMQREEGDHRYRYLLRNNFAKGSFGEVWRAIRMPDELDNTGRRCRSPDIRSQPDSELEEREEWRGDAGTPFILKRLLVEKGGEVRLSGIREKYFGELLMGASATWQQGQATAHADPDKGSGADDDMRGGYSHLVRYMDSFEMHSGRELWLAFRDEGKSLHDWMYDSPTSKSNKGLGVVTPSAWWRWLRTDARGRQEMKSIIWQLLVAVHTCHQHNITHRDIKPANLALVTRPAHSASDASDWQQASNLSLRLIDFGSAWSPAVHHLYGKAGPSKLQETPEYSPPEALFAQEPWLPRRPEKATKYDMWSVGVLFLELLLGTPHVFQISARTRVFLDRHLAGCPDATCKELAYTLRGFLELCIYPPAPLPPLTPNGEKVMENGGTNPAGPLSKSNETDKGSNSGTHRIMKFLEVRQSTLTNLLSCGLKRLKPLLKELTRKVLKKLVSANLEASGSSTRSERSKSGALAWQCSEDSFLNQIKVRDPLGGEAELDIWALRLVRRLLQWNPEERISAQEAMEHAYFRKGTSGGFRCAFCGRDFESRAQCALHSTTVHQEETSPEGHCD